MIHRYNKEDSFEWLEKRHEEEYFKYDYTINSKYEKRTFKDCYYTQMIWLKDYAFDLTKKHSFEFTSKTIKEVAFKVQELAEEFVSKNPEIIKEFVSALQTQEMSESRDDYKSEDYYDEDFYEDFYDDAESLFKETSRNFQKLLVAQVAEYFHNKF